MVKSHQPDRYVMGMISVCSKRALYLWSVDVLALLIETCHVLNNRINPRWCFYSWTWHVGRSVCESDRLKKYWHSINSLRKLTRSTKRLCRGFSPGVPHHRKQKSNQSWAKSLPLTTEVAAEFKGRYFVYNLIIKLLNNSFTTTTGSYWCKKADWSV